MSLKKIKNYFDPRENLILNRKDEDEDEITFEEARDIGAQRVRTERSGMNAMPSTEKQYTGTQTASMPLMTELQKNNLSFDDARQLGMQNHALDYQREIRERALKMMKDAGNKKSPYEALSQEDKSSLDRLYSLKNQLQTFSIYNQTNPQGGNPLLQTQNPYNTDIQQEYNKLYADLNKKGYDVTELIRYYERVKNGEAAEDIKKTLTEKTADHPALMSAASVGLNLLTLQNSFPKAIQDALYDAAYKTNFGIDTNAPEFFGTYSTNAVREKASSDIVEKTREKYGDGAAWAANLLYSTGMSMADSLTANVLGGFTPVGSILQGINAANSSLVDASERGIPAGRALLTAAAAGTFEGLFEHVSLSKLKAMQPEMNSTLKAVGKNILKQMGTEGSEEAATEFANLVFDGIVNQGQSSLAMQRQAYIDQGMSSGEAAGQVIWDAVKQVAEAGLGGALSGVGFGAGGALTNYAKYNYGTRQIGKESLQSGQYGAQLRNALQFDPSSPIGQAAIKMVNRDKISNKAAGRFVTEYDNAAIKAIEGAQTEQQVRDVYNKFEPGEKTVEGMATLARMRDNRLNEIRVVTDKQRVQEAEPTISKEESTAQAVPGQSMQTMKPNHIESALPADSVDPADRSNGQWIVDQENKMLTEGLDQVQYIRPDGSAWRGESEQHETPGAEPGVGTETRYATMHPAKLASTGEDVKVVDISSTEGGKAEVRLSNGKTAKLDELQFEVPEQRTLYSMAKAFPTAKARAFVNHYDGSIGIENYTRAFNVLYEAGYQGKTSLVNAMQKVEGIPRERKKMLSFLYLAGENRAAAEAKAKQERQPVERGSGRFVNKTGEKLDEAMQMLYMGTAAKTGMTIELRNQIQKDANGAFDAGLSRILLSQNADNQIATLVHETAEYVREYNPEGMLDVQEAMLGWYARMRNFETLAEMVEDYRNRYEGQLGEESVGEAMGELTNDAMSALFADEAAAQNFLNWLKEDSGKTAAQQKNILQTIVELFDRLIEKISEYLHGHSLPKAANVFAEGMDLEQMAALRQMFFEAADQARENYDAAEKKTAGKHQATQQAEQSRAQAEGFVELESVGKNKTSVKMENGEEVESEHIDRNNAKYSLNPEFEEQYDQWDKKDPRCKFKVGATSEALKSIGMPDKKIVWDSSKIIKIKAKHSGMTDSVIKQVPHLIEFPVLVMKSKQSDSRITMFGEIYDRNGKPVLGVIELQPTQNGILVDEFKVASAYGKDHAQRFINSSEILYVEPNKNRTHTWLRRTRLQLPVGLNQYGPIGSIARTEEDVNSAASTDSSIRAGEQNDTSSKSTKYMFAGEKARTANRAALERAQRETESELHPSEMIRRSTGWHKGPDGKWRFEIDDSKAQFGDESSNRMGDFLLHEELYEAYPELREIKVEKLGEDAPERLRGRYLADEKKIQYNPNLSQKERMKVMLHEIQHIIQRTEGLGKGGSRKLAERYLFNRAYDYAKTLPSYQSMQTPKQREQFVKDLIAARSHSGDYETAVTEAYRNLFGEIEARNTANRQPLDQRGRQLASPANPKESIVVTDWNEEIRRYKGNQEEMSGAIEPSEADMYNQDKGGEMHDEERDAESAPGIREHKPAIRRGSRTDMDIRGEHGIRSRTLRTGEGIAGESESRGGGIRGEERRDEASTRRDESLGRSGLDQPRLQLKDPEEGTPGYAELLARWGSIKPGYKPFREFKSPKKTSASEWVSLFTRTVGESDAIPDELIEPFKQKILDGVFSHVPISDKIGLETAKKILKGENGVAEGWRQWKNVANGDVQPTKERIILGECLLRLAAENGDAATAMQTAAELAEAGTRAGQAVQAFSVLKKMGGMGQLVYVHRTVAILTKDIEKRFGKSKKWKGIKINQTLAENLVSSQTSEEAEIAMQELCRDIADQVPPTWLDKWNAWRYFAMLCNPRTHFRNIDGNLVFMPIVRIKDIVATWLEHNMKKTMDGKEHTKSYLAEKRYKEFAEQDFPEVQELLFAGGKKNPIDLIYEQRTIFKNQKLEAARKLNFKLMDKEDGIFLKRHYVHALSHYLQANHIDPQKLTKPALERARNYAIQEAQKATFRDASPLASAIQKFGRKNTAAHVLTEGLLPFKKTPINILKRGVEYSTAGLIEAAIRGKQRLKRGEITAAEYIDGLAAGFTGTGVVAIGALLGGLGYVTGGMGDDKEDKFAKLQGEQEYSLKIGGFRFSLEWAAPAALPFFVGVEIAQAFREADEETPVKRIVEAILNIPEPLFNLTMLSTMDSVINAAAFADNKEMAIVYALLTGYITQGWPSFFGATARTIDPTRRRTYIDKNSWIPEPIQRTYQKLFNKIPGLSYLNQPYIDEWGREDKTQNIVVGAFENFLSPGWFSEIRTSDMEQELLRLYEATGESGVLPGYAAKFITVDGEKINFTGDEYTQFSEIRGQTAYSTISEIMSSEEYESMSDAQKVKAVKDAFEFAGSAAKAAVSEYELEGWQQDANEESQEEGTSIGESIAHRAATNGAAPEIASTLEEEGAQAAQERIDLMMEACKSRDEMRAQKGNVKSAITRAYKNQYIKCYEARDAAGMREIRQQLMELRTPVGKLYTMKDFRNWIDN